ncbi:alpha/beta hydrolase [Pseudidiomarina salinarum]|uniref:Alpha/beta hydrolase n=1 Tax=Pseudidiomarina salinarum TaxID=435908 RepID=A0A094IVA6_9GAMM|nr:alpha/beta hydrolase [Pseudidiomarina salinarum]KFZ31057.1 alpha/beta hydrolase [Pseudidiomarina salinarum]RUO71138.1 alpha/beta hydrolase [Pseudidiomarina salinarum]
MNNFFPAVLRLIAKLVILAIAVIAVAVIVFWTPGKPADELAERWATPPSLFMDLHGMQVHIRDEGPRNDPEPVILLHGTSASLHTWEGWAEHLAQHRRVIRMDLPGFGLTGPHPREDYHITAYSEFVIALADSLQIDKFVLAGNSLGGRIAWTTAAVAPERVTRLILVDPSGGYPLPPKSMPLAFHVAQLPVLGQLMDYMLPRFMVRNSLENVYANPDLVTDELVDLYYDMARREGNRQALRQRFQQDDNGHEQAIIRSLEQPTLILWGAQDRLIPVANGYEYARDVRNSELVVFPDLGHIPQEEDPDQSLQPVLNFLGLAEQR